MGRRAANGTRRAIAPEIIAAAFAPLRVGLLMVAAIALCTAPPLRAQGATGDIYGIVVEQAGGALPDVVIVVRNAVTGLERRARSDAQGRFAVNGLPTGTYELSATLSGFAEQRQEAIDVRVGEAVVSSLELRQAPQAETVTLARARSGTEPMRSAVIASIPAGEILNLPLPSRDPLEVTRLTPLLGPDASGDSWNAFGLPASFNAFVVDGADNQNSYSGNAFGQSAHRAGGYQFGQQTVSSVQVNVGVPTAEYGRGAAFVSVVTRSGDERFTGELFERYRDTALTAASPIDTLLGRTHAPTHANHFGGSTGGPLQAGRSSFFAAYDGLRSRDDRQSIANVPLILDSGASAGPGQLESAVSALETRRTQNIGFVRGDSRLADSHRISVRYNHQDLRATGVEPSGEQISTDGTSQTLVETRSLAASLNSALGGTRVNDLRGAFARDNDVSSPIGNRPQADIRDNGALVLRVGADTWNARRTTLERWQLADTLMWPLAAHSLKAGVDVQRTDVRDQLATNVAGSYVFQSPATFGTGTPSDTGESYTQSFPGTGATAGNTTPDADDFAGFVQDTWRIGNTLTLDAGIRYDLQTFRSWSAGAIEPQLAAFGLTTGRPDNDANNWAPRVGLAWSPGARYVARASYGITYARTPAALVSAAQTYGAGSLQTFTLFGSRGEPVPTYPSVLSTIPAGAAPIVVAFTRDFNQPRIQHVNVALEWEWMPHTAVTVTYLNATGRDLPQATERNVGVGTPFPFTDATTGERYQLPVLASGPLSSASRVIAIASTGQSRYNGMTIELRRSFFQGIHYRMAYAFGNASDTGLLSAVMPGTPADRTVFPGGSPESTMRRPADNDRRHRFTSDFVYLTDSFASRQHGMMKSLLDHWRLAAVYSLESGVPYTAFAGADVNGDRNVFNDIAPGTSPNQFRWVKEARIDARIARTIAAGAIDVTLAADVFNVFNAVHDSDIDNTLFTVSGTTFLRNPQFGATSTPSAPRAIQLGVSVSF